MTAQDHPPTSPRYRNSLQEAEALDLVDPLRHFLSTSSPLSSSDDLTATLKDDARDVKSSTDFYIVPAQRDSIINQKVTIRCFTSPSLGCITFPSSSPPPPSVESGEESEAWYDVVLKLDMTEGCGGKIWPAAEVLGSYIASKRLDWQGKKVLELGSGTGLVGFLVAKMVKGCQVWVTDQIPMLPLMSYNLALNTDEMLSPCHVEELNWGTQLPTTVPHAPDVLLLADCVYLEVAFQPLVETMLALSTTSTEILFCYQKRRKADKRFFSLLKRYFAFSDIDDDDLHRTRMYRRQGTQLLRVIKKEQNRR